MKHYTNPGTEEWMEIIKRPLMDWKQIAQVIEPIMQNVKQNGDQALLDYSKKFDMVGLNDLRVSSNEITEAAKDISDDLKRAINLAAKNITRFHEAQKYVTKKIETTPGVTCWRKQVSIEKVGLYIPGGTAPLFSSLLMLGIPAKIAGCHEIVVCSPPQRNGNLHPAILYALKETGLEKVFKVGGAQAIAAMAYGTESIPRVYKIFGPGNQYVTAAKQRVSLEGIAIDMPAGPSEVAIVADKSANPGFIAADLLSQAEHGMDSQVLLVTDSQDLLDKVRSELSKQLVTLPRAEMAEQSLSNSKAVFFDSLNAAMELVNLYAPEHLILNTKNADQLAEQVLNAGSVFIGPWTPESAGDYASGTNHTLPTNGMASRFSGVSLDSYMKQITFQKIDPNGLRNIGPAIENMAEAEGLHAHQRAVSIRLNSDIGD